MVKEEAPRKGGKNRGSMHVLEKLSDRMVKTMRDLGRYADGGGLYLQVGRTGGPSWLFRFMRNGKAREMGLGALESRSLAVASAEARNCRSNCWPALTR